MNDSMNQHSSALLSLSEFHGDDGNRADQTSPERYLELATKCMQKVHSVTSLQIHLGLREYLSHKLWLAIGMAQDCNPSDSLQFTEAYHETFKLLFRLAKEVESFIHTCCIERWSIQHVVMFTSVSKYVSLVGDELDFCRSLLYYAKDGQVCPPSIHDLIRFSGDAEAVTIEDHAMHDREILLEKLKALILLSHPRTLEFKLATYLLGRLTAEPTMCSPGSVGLSSSTSFWEVDYESLEQLQNVGTGGAGTVHKTRWLGELVAEKTFFGSDHPSFRNEVMILAGLSHPNIVPLFCYAMDNRQCSIVMELMEGDLFHLMKSRLRRDKSLDSPFTIYEVVDIISQVAEGMYHLHQNNVVHRDLKSHNILVKSAKDVDMEYVHVKVTDFGLSKIKEMSTTFSNQTLNTGTTRWMAPELIPHDAAHNQGGMSTYGEAKKYPFKSDVYSFAMVCHEILTGEVPFQTTSSLRDVKRMVLNGERPNLPNLCPSILKTLIEECWTSDASARPSFDSICMTLRTLKCSLMTGMGQEKQRALAQVFPMYNFLAGTEEEKRRVLAQVHWAVHNDDVEALKKLWSEEDGPALLNAAHYDKRTPLHVAASNNSFMAAQLLLAAGAFVDPLDRWNNTPLANAQKLGFKPMVKLLKWYGAQLVADRGPESDQGNRTIHPTQSWNWLIVDSGEINLEDGVLIGKGSFGVVRQATWRGMTVAVKTIRPSLSKDREVVKDFINEVELLVKLRHPNIVQFLGAVITKPPLMLVTEYLPGDDLHALIQKGPVPADLAVTLALDVARGMAYLHGGPNVIHRDLKPSNLIINESNELKVGDFGLSKLIKVKNVHEVYKLTGETGSYRYMAPEVFLHENYNAKVDVFSFAMILYEMFEGAIPFADEDPYEAAFMVAKENKRPEFGVKTHYPEGMKELIIKCWSVFALRRPQFDHIVQELVQIQEKNGILRSALLSTSLLRQIQGPEFQCFFRGSSRNRSDPWMNLFRSHPEFSAPGHRWRRS